MKAGNCGHFIHYYIAKCLAQNMTLNQYPSNEWMSKKAAGQTKTTLSPALGSEKHRMAMVGPSWTFQDFGRWGKGKGVF